jgi:transcriptional regulator with XRE-family HTH domain
MLLGDRLRSIREAKDMSQGDIEKRTGLLRCYLSRVECGHTVPSIETLEKLAAAFEIPLYELFYDGEKKPDLPKLNKQISMRGPEWGDSPTQSSKFRKLRVHLSKMKDYNRALLLTLAGRMVSSKRRATSRASKA